MAAKNENPAVLAAEKAFRAAHAAVKLKGSVTDKLGSKPYRWSHNGVTVDDTDTSPVGPFMSIFAPGRVIVYLRKEGKEAFGYMQRVDFRLGDAAALERLAREFGYTPR